MNSTPHNPQKTRPSRLGEKLLMEFELNPIPAIRTTTNQYKLLRIPRHKLQPKERQLADRLDRYEKYKGDCKLLATVKRFKMPDSNVHIVFFLETNDSLLWGHPHRERTPDWDNLVKAIQDAICSKDHHIWNVMVSKYWTQPKNGRTEIWEIKPLGA